MARNAGKVLTHGTLATHVWRTGGHQANSLRVHVTQLGHNLGTGPHRLVLDDAANNRDSRP